MSTLRRLRWSLAGTALALVLLITPQAQATHMPGFGHDNPLASAERTSTSCSDPLVCLKVDTNYATADFAIWGNHKGTNAGSGGCWGRRARPRARPESRAGIPAVERVPVFTATRLRRPLRPSASWVRSNRQLRATAPPQSAVSTTAPAASGLACGAPTRAVAGGATSPPAASEPA